MANAKREYIINGSEFSTLDEFYDVVSAVLIPDACWGRNLDAFNDLLRGGFGTPDDGFRIRWINSDQSRRNLGYAETVRQLEQRLSKCHPDHLLEITARRDDAKKKVGSTVFDWLIEIILDHCDGGEESEDNIELFLEY